ncbi:MAG: hypothetical protein Q7S22_08515 [Candidatus Micrarchaeota archaeon]|nr:hypothetical protein [Candidatus Micrarchaeota archaeon]
MSFGRGLKFCHNLPRFLIRTAALSFLFSTVQPLFDVAESIATDKYTIFLRRSELGEPAATFERKIIVCTTKIEPEVEKKMGSIDKAFNEIFADKTGTQITVVHALAGRMTRILGISSVPELTKEEEKMLEEKMIKVLDSLGIDRSKCISLELDYTRGPKSWSPPPDLKEDDIPCEDCTDDDGVNAHTMLQLNRLKTG